MTTSSTNFPLDAIEVPSYASMEDSRILDVCVNTNIVIHEIILDAFLHMHAKSVDRVFEECAATAITFVDNVTATTAMGPCREHGPDENTLTGLFAGLLQHLLSTQLAPIANGGDLPLAPEILVSTQQRMGNNGITMHKVVDAGLHPRVCWEFSVNRSAKEGKLFADVNNMDCFLPTEYQIVALGVNVVMERDQHPEMQVHAYVKIRSATRKLHANAAVPKPLLGRCLLYKGDWSHYNLSRLLFCMHQWMRLPMSAFLLPPTGLLSDQPHSRRAVLCRSIAEQQWVYKVFDGRSQQGTSARRYQPNLDFIDGCEIVLQEREVALIRYPLKHGTHLPTLSRDIPAILRHLDRVHKLGFVHCDIKASNLLFFGTHSCVLDFNLCGRVGAATYPDGYNVNISDGVRHPRIVRMLAQGSDGYAPQRRRIAELGDDWYSLAAVLRFVQPVAVDQRPLWARWCDAVQAGRLQEVATEMDCAEDVPLEPVSAAPWAVPLFGAEAVTGAVRDSGAALPPAVPGERSAVS